MQIKKKGGKPIKKFLSNIGNQRGEINLAGLIMMGIAMIFIAVGFIVYPVILEGTDDIAAWEYTCTDNESQMYDIDDFTGLDAVNGIVPLIVLVGFIAAGVISGFLGFKMMKGGGGNLSPGNLMLLAIGMIFIAVGLIIYPVIMDAIASVLCGGITGYTGLEPILLVTPLIVLVAFIAGGIITGFFGIKSMAKGGG
jgi:predicted PurR-regulated permease PerM